MSNAPRDQITHRGCPHCGPRSSISIVECMFEEVLQQVPTCAKPNSSCGMAQGDNCNLSNVTRFSKHSTSWQRRRWRQQLKPPRRQWRRWRQRRHESQLSSGLFQFWTACIFTCSCILVTCTLKASDLIGKNWTSKSEVCMWYNSIIQPANNKARNPAPLIPLKLHLMGKLSNHFDPLPSS